MPSANVNGTEGQCLELLVLVSGCLKVPSSEEERGECKCFLQRRESLAGTAVCMEWSSTERDFQGTKNLDT